MGPGQACRTPGSEDLVFLGRLALARLDPSGDGPRGVLLSASRHDGLYGFVQTGTALTADPTWIQCLRSADGDTLSDVATARWRLDGNDEEISLAAVVGHRRLEVLEIGADGRPLLPALAADDLGWAPFRVAVDPVNRLILVRDNDAHLAVYSLTRRPEPDDDGLRRPDLVADIVLPDGAGMGPLVVDPESGLAFTGTAPVQYTPPSVGLVADADNDGLPERVDYLQPLGAPAAPVTADGRRPPHLAWVYAHVAGVPDGTDTLVARVAGLGPGGAPLPVRPEPFLPSSTLVELTRTPGLPLDDPGRHYFVSERPILLVADERARSEYWQAVELDPTELERLTHDPGNGAYPVCRNCDRDIDDNGTPDLPWGEPAPHPDPLTVAAGPGDAPWELAAAARLRVTLETGNAGGSAWLEALEDTGLEPDAEAVSVAWMGSPTLTRVQGMEVRGAAAPEVELVSGAASLSRSDLDLPAPGLNVGASRSYTSGGIVWGDLGWGWSLAGVNRLRPNPDGTADLLTADGARYVFSRGADHPGSSDTTLTALRHPGELQHLRSGEWMLLHPDDGYSLFDEAGYLTRARDRFRKDTRTGSELRWLWNADGTLSHQTLPRSIRFERDPVTGVITAAEDATGRRYEYAYDAHGRLTGASMDSVELDASGTTGVVSESYVPTLASMAVSDLDRGAQIGDVERADGTVSLRLGWQERRVTTVERGPGNEPVRVAISPESDTEWTLTEGQTAANPSITRVSLADDGDGWLHTVVQDPAGSGLTSTTRLDRDGRVVESTDPGGVTTVTDYVDGRRLVTFSPARVTTTPGTVGESRPETPAALMTLYRYHEGTTLLAEIDRPGPNTAQRLVTTMERSAQDYPTTVTAPDGTVTTRTYDEVGRLRTVSSSSGALTEMVTYDDLTHGSGELLVSRSTSTAADGNPLVATTTLSRDERGFVTASRSHDGVSPDRLSATEVNAPGWTLESRSGASTSRTSYNADGRITGIVSGTGQGDGFAGLVTTVPDYTSAGMIRDITRYQGGATEVSSVTYDDAGHVNTSTTAGLTTVYTYDPSGRTRTRTEGVLPATLYTYNAAGRLETTTTPGGKAWTSVYDTLGRSTGRIDPAGVREDLTLKPTGEIEQRRLKVGDQVWAWEQYAYDDLGRPASRTVHRFPVTPEPDLSAPEALTTTTAYYLPGDPDDPDGHQLGMVKSITDPLGRVTSFTYDDAGRERLRSLPDGTELETAYLPDGKVPTRTMRYTGPEGAWELTTETTYDDQGRVHTVTRPGGRVSTTLYDALGRKQSEVTPDSVPADDGSEQPVERLTTWAYGDLGREVTTTRPDGATITRSYDERGNLTAYEDHGANRTEYAYDDHGRLHTITYPDATSRSFTYTPDGQVETITRADSSVVTFAHDQATGRLDTVTVSADGVQPGGPVSFTWNPVGNLVSAGDNDVVLAFAWDSAGNQLSESLELPGMAPGLGAKGVTRVFDRGNRPAVAGMPDGEPYLQRLYDAGSRLAGLHLRADVPADLADPAGGQPLWQGTYAGSRLVRMDRGNGLATLFSYDAEGRPTDVLTGPAAPGEEATRAVHRLGLGWTRGDLRRDKTRRDLRRQVERFHYDGAAHLESDVTRGIPAVAELDEDLTTMVPGLEPLRLTEEWSVSQVDELVQRSRTHKGLMQSPKRIHDDQGLHQVRQLSWLHYAWSEDGNLEQTMIELPDGTMSTVAEYTHDWRDRLVGVDQDTVSTRLVVDPLGRLVAKVQQTPDGELTRVYLHDGDQVVAEYVQEAGGTGWQLERRHHWGRWIDDLVTEEVDTDADGTLDTTLYPITDLLGSVQLLTDEDGAIAERITYDTDGTPRFWSADTNPPVVTRVAWTGDGNRPTGDSVSPNVIEIGFSEWIDEHSVASATATLTPDGEDPVVLAVVLGPDLRTAELSGAQISGGISYALHIEGLWDRSGNLLETVDLPLVVADPTAYEVVEDSEPPQVFAVMDAADGLYLMLDEPVVEDGVSLADSITVVRAGNGVAGTTTRVTAELLRWEPADQSTWLIGGQYTVSQAQLVDLLGNPVTIASPATFAHLAATENDALVVSQIGDDSQPLGQSQYGARNLFQGREWHGELSLYYHRSRWYSHRAIAFVERDPLGHADGQNTYMPIVYSPPNLVDPDGLKGVICHAEFRLSECLDDSHAFLVKRGLASRSLNWYGYVDMAGIHWVPNESTSHNGTVWISMPPMLTQAIDWHTALISYEGSKHQVSRAPMGILGWRIFFGRAPAEREGRVMFQRMRLYQVERIIDRYVDRKESGRRIPHITREGTEFMNLYRSLHVRASWDLLRKAALFIKIQPRAVRPTSNWHRAYSVIASAIIVNSADADSAKEDVEAYLNRHDGIGVFRLYKRGSHPYWEYSVSQYPWSIGVKAHAKIKKPEQP